MTEAKRRGRPPLSEYCVDCYREGKEPPDARPKVYGSYCGMHYKIRQQVTKIKRSYRKTIIWGRWPQIPETATVALVAMCDENIAKLYKENEAYGDPVQIALHLPMANSRAFEFDCVRHAIEFRRRLTTKEEDEILEAYGGSRTGTPAMRPMGPDGVRPIIGAILLPDPNIRTAFRAMGNGGPTTEGEPSFTTYYEKHFKAGPPAELTEDLDPNEEVEASDGQPTPRSFLQQYEALLRTGQVKPYYERIAELDQIPDLPLEPEKPKFDGSTQSSWEDRHKNTP